MVGRYIALVSILGMLTLSACFGGSGGPEPPDSQPPEPTGIPWAMPGGNAARTGSTELWGPYIAEADVLPAVEWEAFAPGSTEHTLLICSCPVIDQDGNSYVASEFDIYSTDPQGNVRWQLNADEDLGGFAIEADTSPILLVDDLLIAASGYGEIWAFSTTGLLQWSLDLPGNGVQMVPVQDQLMVVHGDMLYAVDLAGNVLWERELDGIPAWGVALAAADHGDILVALNDGQFVAYAMNGERRWSYTSSLVPSPDETPNWRYPVYSGGHWLVPTATGMAAIYENGTEAWRFSIPNAEALGLITHAPAVSEDGTILLPVAVSGNPHLEGLSAYDTSLYALNPDGSAKWEFNFSEWISDVDWFVQVRSVTVDGLGRVYAELNGSASVFDDEGNHLTGFKLRGSTRTTTWGMAIAPGRRMIVGYQRDLCFAVSTSQ